MDKISKSERKQLLNLYQKETGNPIIEPFFKLSDYLEWMEYALISLLNIE